VEYQRNRASMVAIAAPEVALKASRLHGSAFNQQ
jgi:hypothetical protein